MFTITCLGIRHKYNSAEITLKQSEKVIVVHLYENEQPECKFNYFSTQYNFAFAKLSLVQDRDTNISPLNKRRR